MRATTRRRRRRVPRARRAVPLRTRGRAQPGARPARTAPRRATPLRLRSHVRRRRGGGRGRRLPAPDAAARRRAQPLRESRGSGCRRRRGDRHASGASRRGRPGGGGGPVRRRVVALDRLPRPGSPCGSASTLRRTVHPVPRAPGHMRERRVRTTCRPSSPGCERSRTRRSARRRTSRTSSSPIAGGRPIPTAPGSSGTTAARSRWPAYGNPTPSGIRVGPVYTPPEHRGRGYATSLVADLTAERLAAGLAFCFLFTDLANPTSNAIYARIGYEPVADWDQWSFQPLER